MNFGFAEDQEVLRALTVKVLDDFCPAGRPPAPADDQLWKALCDAGCVGAAFALPHGGGQGLTGLCIVAEELGRRAALTPLWANGVAGLTIEALAPGLADGSAIASLAFEEAANPDSRRPHWTTAEKAGDGRYRLTGRKIAVPYAARADVHLVSALAGDHNILAVVRDATVEVTEGTDGEPSGTLVLDGSEAEMVLGQETLDRVLDLATAVVCATTAGVIDGGLRLTADYIAGREQFGRPIATFQGPAMRIADAYIDAQAVWTSTWSAIWRIESGRPAREALAIAKFWAADGGQRAVHAFQHLHGGMGVDTSYPIHRYFYMAKALEVRLGGATAQLDRLGGELAEAK